MSILNISNTKSDNSFPDLSSAVNISNDNDQIKLSKNITIPNGITINHDLVIDGNNHQLETSTGQVALILTGITLTLSNLKIVVVDKSNFLKLVLEDSNHLIMNNVTIIHEPFTGTAGNVEGFNEHAANVYPSMLTHNDNQQRPIQSQSVEFHNCNIDYVTIDVNNLDIDNSTVLGDCLINESFITADQLTIENSQINNTHFAISSQNKQDNVAKLRNVNTNGGITVNGNLNINEFKVIPINILKLKQFPLNATSFSQYALTIENDNIDKIKTININHANLNKKNLSQQSSIYNVAGWFDFSNANVTINDSQISPTISVNNEINGGSLKLNQTVDHSKWNKSNLINEKGKAKEVKSDQDEPNVIKLKPKKNSSNSKSSSKKETISDLNNLVGLKKVKRQINEFIAVLKTNQIRKQRGLKTTNLPMNMIFEGNLGSGKQTVAKIVSQALATDGILSNSKLKVVNSLDLVDEFIGATPEKTSKIVHEALDGVLFINNADQLAQTDNESENKFKDEAITTLIKEAKANYGRIVIILAGPQDEMNSFISKRSAEFKANFSDKLIFPDYSANELIKILKLKLANRGMSYDDNAFKLIASKIKQTYSYGEITNNASFVQDIVDDLVKQQSARISEKNSTNLSNDELNHIEKTDAQNTINYSSILTNSSENSGQNSSSDNDVVNFKKNINKLLNESNNDILNDIADLHQTLDDITEPYDNKLQAAQGLQRMQTKYQEKTKSQNDQEVKIAKLILPLVTKYDSNVDYQRLISQINQLNK